MKKIIFSFIAILSIILVLGYKQYSQNDISEKYANNGNQKDSKSVNQTDVIRSRTSLESSTLKDTSENKPRILLMLKNETGMAKWSPSLWWSYQYANLNQPGC
jgi:hypothetical protein